MCQESLVVFSIFRFLREAIAPLAASAVFLAACGAIPKDFQLRLEGLEKLDPVASKQFLTANGKLRTRISELNKELQTLKERSAPFLTRSDGFIVEVAAIEDQTKFILKQYSSENSAAVNLVHENLSLSQSLSINVILRQGEVPTYFLKPSVSSGRAKVRLIRVSTEGRQVLQALDVKPGQELEAMQFSLRSPDRKRVARGYPPRGRPYHGWQSSACEKGEVVVGIKTNHYGTCREQCNADGSIIRTVQVVCAKF